MRGLIIPVLILAAVGACQSTSEGGGGSGGFPHDRITLEEMEELADISALNARQTIQRLRPSWLRPRSSSLRARYLPVVFQDGLKMGGLENLDRVQAWQLNEIRHLSAADATSRYGTGYPGGIILLVTRRGEGALAQ